MNLFNLFEGNEQAYNWHSEPEQRSMDATRQARLNREREPEGSEAIDARLRAQNDQLAQYAQSGQFWLKQKDTQDHISDAFVGKAAANAAALELLKQRPELKGNLVITAWGPGETQGVAEGSPFDTLNKQALAAKKEKQRQLDQAAKFIDSKKTQPPKNKGQGVAEGQGRFAGDTPVNVGGAVVNKIQAGDTVKYFGEKARVIELNPAKNYARISANSKTLNVRLSDLKQTGQGMAEAPGAETLGHNQSTVSSNLSSLDLGEAHNPYGYEVGQSVKLSNGKRGRVIDIFDDSIEVMLPGGHTVTVDFRDAEVLGEAGDRPEVRTPPGQFDPMMDKFKASLPNKPAGTAPSRPARMPSQSEAPRQAWADSVVKQFPGAKIMMTKTPNGPAVATLNGKTVASYPETQNVDEAYDPAAAAKIIGVATKAGIRIFYDKFSSDSNFRNQIDAEYGFKYQDIKISAISTAIGFAKSAMAWLNARGAYLTYNPKNPVDFQLTMPDQTEPYTFNVFDVMERWKPYAESAPAAGNRTAKFDPSTGLPLSKQLSELEGDVANYPPVVGTPPQNQPNTEQPPRRGYSIILTGKPGRDWMAEYAWQALEKVFPREYPGNSSVSNYSGDKTVTPAMQKVLQAHNGPVVVKSGIASEDIAETLVAKLVANRVPANFWRITSEDLDEGDISQLEKNIADAPVAPIANMEANEKIGGRHDADDFDAMVNRLKKLAGSGPMKTVWDPVRRVYKNMPTAQQPKK